MFWKKKEEEKKAFDMPLEWIKRQENVEIRLKKAENDILGLVTENEVIRNKVLRKIQFKREPIEEEEKEESGLLKSKPLNTFNPFAP